MTHGVRIGMWGLLVSLITLLTFSRPAVEAQKEQKEIVVKGAVRDGRGSAIQPSIILSIVESQHNERVVCGRNGKFQHALKQKPLPKEIVLQFYYAGVPVRNIRFLSGKMPQYLNVVIYPNSQLGALDPRIAMLELNELEGFLLLASTASKDSNDQLRTPCERSELEARIRYLNERGSEFKGLISNKNLNASFQGTAGLLKNWAKKW